MCGAFKNFIGMKPAKTVDRSSDRSESSLTRKINLLNSQSACMCTSTQKTRTWYLDRVCTYGVNPCPLL